MIWRNNAPIDIHLNSLIEYAIEKAKLQTIQGEVLLDFLDKCGNFSSLLGQYMKHLEENTNAD